MTRTLKLLASVALGLLAAPLLSAQSTCGAGSLCGSSAPCCSEFGFCGDGTQCLGGCNPLHSHSLDSCTPSPICADETTTFNTLDRVLTNYTIYEGNATTHDWVVDSGKVFISSKNELVLALTKDNNGTRISSTRYVHYGTITATLKTARSAGVVNAFITMSDVRDEIDWEWPGAQTSQAQSNYFFLGQVDYSNSHGATHDGLSDTYANYHDYTIDWTPDTLTWSIDGNPVRTLQKTDTLSKDGSYYAYPTTPARVQLSIWPAGIPGAPQGTVDWAGGMIDWTDPDYVAQGQFSTIVKSVTIKCAKETSTTIANNGTLPANPRSYVYTKNDTVVPRVLVSNESTNVNSASLHGVAVGRTVSVVGGMAVLLGLGGFLL
ncbi:glycoside hydrolase family 16 protein [Tulasnella calospora MUT 4182]|uniref:Glycoside hydrolase family 16 protein n=1 Tax=Tulasnella calospora MUT 4182 TaxID=1051891 RepID=A0A0C3QTC7_9AGAM|nr:glycoside hydrolase family 16 protein [Tulasnella calospora MUT 4182]